MTDLDFFSSPIGLGHVTRDIAIANNFENISTKFVTGSGATKILKNLEYSDDKIQKVKKCILSHRYKTENRPKTIEEKIR